MQLINKFNKEICLLLCLIDICSKYAWVVSLKDKIWVDKKTVNFTIDR